VGLVLVATAVGASAGEKPAKDSLSKLDVKRGIVAVLGVPNNNAAALIEFVKNSELTFYVQSDDLNEVAEVRRAAGLLGRRVFVDSGPTTSIHLSDNVADGILPVLPGVWPICFAGSHVCRRQHVVSRRQLRRKLVQ
jgi:hypothetical protein